MNFIAPEFLYALGFLAIPILIHLFNFRRYKTVQFSQVRFLKSIKKQTQSTSKLKHLIVLSCRCIALSGLVFAFAQPYLSDEKIETIGEKNGVVIYLDNSFSLQMSAEVGSLLDQAKNKALAITEAYSAADKFQIHTNNFNGDEQRWLNKEGFISKLQNIDFSPRFRTFDAVLNRITSIDNKEQLTLKHFIIGDLQETSYSISTIHDSLRVSVLPLKSQISDNVWISHFQSFQPFHLPAMAESFSLQLQQNANSAKEKINGKLILNDQIKNPFIVEISEDSTTKEINFINPDNLSVQGKIAINDYPVVFDDTFYFYYSTDRKIKVLHLFENIKNNSVHSLYTADSLIDYASFNIKQIDFSKLKKSNLVILENINQLSTGLIAELTSFSKQGGSIAIFPSSKMNSTSINLFLNQFGIGGYNNVVSDTLNVNEININSTLFKDVFEQAPRNINYPKVFDSWELKSDYNNLSEKLFSFSNGKAFLKRYEVNGSNFYLCSSNLETSSSNFGKHALFVPSLYNMALQSANSSKTSYLLDETKITLKNITSSKSPIKLKKGDYEWIPKQQSINNSTEIYLRNQVVDPGFYSVILNDIEIDKLAFNYNRKESNLTQFTAEQFKNQAELKGLTIDIFESNNEILTNEIDDFGTAQSLWKYCIVLCLLFIGLEILFLRIL